MLDFEKLKDELKVKLNEAKNSQKHIETVNLDRFIDLWKQTYRDLTEADKSLLPLREIMFLAPLD